MLQLEGLRTIQSYPDEWIHIYTDGSATNGTKNAGLGIRVEFADKTLKEISNPCGVLCSNFDAEAKAIETALQYIRETFENVKEKCGNIVIFSDCKSVLQVIKNDDNKLNITQKITNYISELIDNFSIRIILQWIPSHCELPGNEAADRLAKKGACLDQPDIPVNQNTCKQIIKEKSKKEWLDNWTQCNTGRTIYAHLKAPNPNDAINNLGRREQVAIYRLRTEHVQLNKHLSRIKADHSPR